MASIASVAGTIKMDKGEIVKTIYERMLVEDTKAYEKAWSYMIDFGIKCSSRTLVHIGWGERWQWPWASTGSLNGGGQSIKH